MTVINTNVGALTARTYAVSANESMQKAMERLSSGLRINSAADDAAGLSVANKMESQLRGMNVAIRNSQDGISLVQTAEAGMGEITNMIVRMRELAVQMNNGVYTSSDRSNAQLEITALLAEVDKISDNTAFNDVKVLDGTYSTDIRAGNTNAEVINVAIDSMKTDALAAAAPLSNENSATGTSSDYAIRSADVTVSAQEAFRVNIGAPTPSSTGTELEQFAAIFTGGTYSLAGDDADDYTIAADGSIASNAAVAHSSSGSNEVSLTRTYTSSDSTETFSENITLTITENATESLVRAATSTLIVGKSDDLTINAVATGSVSNGAIDFTSTVARGSLSSELATFIDTAGNANGAFTLTGTDAANFDVDAATGAITLKADVSGSTQYDLTADAALTLTYTAENGDAFVETIAIDQQAGSQVSAAQAISVNVGDSGNITVDLEGVNKADYASDDFLAFVAAKVADSETITYSIANQSGNAVADATLPGSSYDILAAGATTGDTYEVIATASGGDVFTETVTLTVADTTTATAQTGIASTAYTPSVNANAIGLTATGVNTNTLNFDLTSSSNVSDEFLLAAGRASTAVYDVTAASGTINSGLTGELGAQDFVSIAGDVASTEAFTVAIRDGAGGSVLHTETFTITVAGVAGPMNVDSSTDVFADTTTQTASTVDVSVDLAAGQNLTFDLTSTDFVSQALIDAAARSATDGTTGYRLTGAVAGINGNATAITGTSLVVDAATTDNTQIVIEVFDTANPANVYHTETVDFDVNSIAATTSAATSDTASQNATTVVANTANTVTANTTVGADSSATVTAATGDSTAGISARANSALTAVEANSVKVETSNLSSELAAFVAANSGGTYTISGTDAALFDVNESNGEVMSKAGLDFETPTDSDTDNQYDVKITYTSGTDTFEENVALTITNFADDDGSTLADVDLSTQAGSAEAVTILDTALAQVSSSQAKLGAIQNRLQHNIDNLSMASMLTETSRGRIVDADFARETSELSKQQILNQAATSMLAQANGSKQSVLALLQ